MDPDRSNLDLLRTCAVAMVVFSHVAAALGLQDSRWYHVQALGLLGVILFFVHTALVLMMSLSRDAQAKGRSTRFWIRRVIRIYPLSIAVVCAVTLIADARNPIPVGTLVSDLLLVQNLTGTESIPAPLWSLPFEIQMYAVLPAIYSLTLLEHALAKVLATWGFAACAVLACWRLGLNYQLVKFVPCFLSGVVAFVLMRSRPGWLSPGVLFASVLFAAVLYPVGVARGLPESVLAWPTSLGVGLLLAGCRDLSSPAVARLGKTVATYSYGIYLVHAPVLDCAMRLLPGHVILEILIFVAGTAVLSWISYHWIEKPGIRLGRLIASRMSEARPLRISTDP